MNITFPCYLIHPENGTHVAYDAGEVDRLTKWYGWSIRVNGARESAPIEPGERLEQVQVVEKRRPGRPRKVN